MFDVLREACLFLMDSVFSLFLYIFMLRLLLAYVHADHFNPLTRLVTKCTDFIVKPMRRYVPNIYRIETASLICLIALAAFKYLILGLFNATAPNVVGIFILIVADVLRLLIQTFFYAILLGAILSWVQPQSAFIRILNQLTSPLMRPIQRFVPTVGGFDISPLPAFILLQLLLIILVSPLMNMGMHVAFA